MLSLTELRSRAEAAEITTEMVTSAPASVDPILPWVAAQTNPRCEVRAMHGIASLGWRTFVPFGWKWARPRHAPSDMHVLRRRPGLPGYVFMIAPLDARGDFRTPEARLVDGVKCIVSQAGRPLEIRPAAIELLMMAVAKGVYDHNKEPARRLKDVWNLAPGDRIKITAGVGEGMLATVQRRSNAKEVEVRDDVFGIRLTVPLDRLVPIDLES